MLHPAALRHLRPFRAELCRCSVRRVDALFGLVEALLASDGLPSLAHLSLAALHRRGRDSVYDALPNPSWSSSSATPERPGSVR